MGGTDVVASVVSSQIDEHARFGGVVPEIASRAHLESVMPVVRRALAQSPIDFTRVDAVAATVGPGLVGALLVGVSAAKALALALDRPFIGVNHLEAHLYAAFLDDPSVSFPMVVLLVSGGNTLIVHVTDHGKYHVIGQTIDDAAGEAFDKVARFLELPQPGGPSIDKMARIGDPRSIDFPRAMLHDGLDVSFSGLKTAVINHVREHPDVETADVAASFQQAVVDVLVAKTMRAVEATGVGTVALGGGVAANSLLRSRMQEVCAERGWHLVLPSREMCTDNAAMIASAAWYRLRDGASSPLDMEAQPNLKLGDPL
jgi:N6-L-threonylcarbamoyladenine synthase